MIMAAGPTKKKPYVWPKVSVIISTYNRPKMLKEALQSCLDQDAVEFSDWTFEVIVVDDGSSTARPVCEEMRKAFEKVDVGLLCLELAENTGYQCIPKNIGIQHAAGAYIAYLDDDNVFYHDHLSTLVDEIERMGCDAVYSRWRYEGDGPGSGTNFPLTTATPAAFAGVMQSPAFNFVDTSSILHSKSAFVALLGERVWNPEVRRFGDWEMFTRSLESGLRWRHADAVTFEYRWHGENLQLTRPVNEGTVRLGR